MIFPFFENIYPLPAWRKLRYEGDVVVIMNEELQIIYLNETAGFFLDCVTGKRNIKDIVQIMANEYEVAEDVLKNDILLLLRDLQWNKLIKLSKSPR